MSTYTVEKNPVMTMDARFVTRGWRLVDDETGRIVATYRTKKAALTGKEIREQAGEPIVVAPADWDSVEA